MQIMYQQPHLVPPMKLTVWDDLPPTPTPLSSQFTNFFTQGRHFSSRASGLASPVLRKRKTMSKAIISCPRPIAMTDEAAPCRNRSFRRLELSIYMPEHRLSDLPEFDAVSFTEVGEIRFPPRALLRTRSEEVLTITPPAPAAMPKPASMYERTASHTRHTTASSIISTSRPPSEYDALHSHPVSWASVPGLPPYIAMAKAEASVTVLTPMQEEFTPPATSNLINDIVMDFPQIEDNQAKARESTVTDQQVQAPSPKIPSRTSEPPLPAFTNAEPNPPAQYFHTNYQTQKRISQWLGNRSHSSSVSTVKTTSTSSSFAEHRRKRSQFYLLSANRVQPPNPLRLHKPQHQHQRTMTASTVSSTVDTDIMSLDNDDIESMTTAPTISELQSRTGTIRSVHSGPPIMNGVALKPIVSGIPDLPESYGEIVEGKADGLVVIREINGPLRSHGVGLAF